MIRALLNWLLGLAPGGKVHEVHSGKYLRWLATRDYAPTFRYNPERGRKGGGRNDG